MPSPRRDATKKKLAEFERSFGLLMHKLGNFESDTIISMYNTQMQGEAVWKASVKYATDRAAALSKQRDELQAKLLALRDKDYTVQSAEDDSAQCSFGGTQLRKRLNAPASPSSTGDSAIGVTVASHRPSSAADSDVDGDFDLMQFKPLNSAMLDIATKKAGLKTDKLIETERVLAALNMGVCALLLSFSMRFAHVSLRKSFCKNCGRYFG
jgi:hypothetical protein